MWVFLFDKLCRDTKFTGMPTIYIGSTSIRGATTGNCIKNWKVTWSCYMGRKWLGLQNLAKANKYHVINRRSFFLPTFVCFALFTHFLHILLFSEVGVTAVLQLSAAGQIMLITYASSFNVMRRVCERRKAYERRQKRQGISVDWLNHFCGVSRKPCDFQL